MDSMLTQDPLARDTEAPGDFELVMGRTQLASLLFLVSMVLILFSALSYLAGRASAPKQTAVRQVLVSAPASAAPAQAPPAEQAKSQPKPEPPIFADPVPGKLYLQMGAVDRGMATVFVDGLRREELPAFAAPGPSEKIFRVLIGPITDTQAFTRTKEVVDRIGLSTFARKYQVPSASSAEVTSQAGTQ